MDANTSPTQSNDHKFWLTFEQTAVGIALLRPDGRFMRANPELCKFLGYSESELLEISLQNITHRDDLESSQKLMRQVEDHEISSFRAEKRFIRRNGKTVRGLQSVSVVRDKHDKPLQYIAVIQDITGSKQATPQASRDDHPAPDDRLLPLLEAVPLGMLLVAGDGLPQFANSAARDLLGEGIAPGTKGRPVYPMMRAGTGKEYPAKKAPIARALAGETVTVTDVEIKRPDGLVPVQMWAAPVLDDEGNVISALAAIGRLEIRETIREIVHETIVEVKAEAEPESGSWRELLKLTAEVAGAVASTTDLYEAIRFCLERVCRVTGLPVGHMLLARGETNKRGSSHVYLASSGIWHMDEPDRYEPLRKAGEHTTFTPGEDLPGRVLQTWEAAWDVDLSLHPLSPRNKLVWKAGSTAALAFPVLTNGGIIGVMEFFAPRAVEPDGLLLDIMAQIGAHLGDAIVRRVALDELERAHKRYLAVAELSPDLVSAHDTEGRYIFAGKASLALLGYDTQELAGMSMPAYCHPEDAPRLTQMFNRYLAGSDEQLALRCRMLHKGGEYRWFDLLAQPVAGTYGRSREIVLVARLALEGASSSQDQLEAQPVAAPQESFSGAQSAPEPEDRDPLTSLPNREATDDLLTVKVSSRRAATYPVGCLFVDVDDFDGIAESYGREVGDNVLRKVAAVLMETCRDEDFVARYEGSSFMIVLSNTDAAGTIVVGEKALRKIREVNWDEQGLESVKASIGGTCLRHGHDFTLSELMELVGSQLLQAKGSGGDCIIMNARDALHQPTGMDPLGGWTHTLRVALNGQVPGASSPGHPIGPPEPGNYPT